MNKAEQQILCFLILLLLVALIAENDHSSFSLGEGADAEDIAIFFRNGTIHEISSKDSEEEIKIWM